jgi:AraC-like DNA-binding protein
MILSRIQPRKELTNYIDTFWVFENDFGVPVADNRVIAPNGKAKIIYPYLNGLATTSNGIKTHYPEQDVYLIGIWDRPVTLSSFVRVTGTIGLELKPNGIYRFASITMADIANRIFSFTDIYGLKGKRLLEQLATTVSLTQKIEVLQDFLVAILQSTNRENALIDYSVSRIQSAAGLVEVKELEKLTGYSKRYLDMLFKEHLGISPKTLASIVRFQSFYKAWATTATPDFYTDKLFDIYYDQAHFIKEFKRFTGHTPRQYATDRNDFGKIFYKP